KLCPAPVHWCWQIINAPIESRVRHPSRYSEDGLLYHLLVLEEIVSRRRAHQSGLHHEGSRVGFVEVAFVDGVTLRGLNAAMRRIKQREDVIPSHAVRCGVANMRRKKRVECRVSGTGWLSSYTRIGLRESAASRANNLLQRNPALIDKVIEEQYCTAVGVDILVGILGCGYEVEA